MQSSEALDDHFQPAAVRLQVQFRRHRNGGLFGLSVGFAFGLGPENRTGLRLLRRLHPFLFFRGTNFEEIFAGLRAGSLVLAMLLPLWGLQMLLVLVLLATSRGNLKPTSNAAALSGSSWTERPNWVSYGCSLHFVARHLSQRTLRIGEGVLQQSENAPALAEKVARSVCAVRPGQVINKTRHLEPWAAAFLGCRHRCIALTQGLRRSLDIQRDDGKMPGKQPRKRPSGSS